jgi:3-methyladenine DNA glycosylase AlkD
MMKIDPPERNTTDLVCALNYLANPEIQVSQMRFGITPKNSLGVSIPNIRSLAKCRKNHKLALNLWKTGIHEARILATMVDEVDKVTRNQMDSWAADFDSWDICDQTIINLFERAAPAFDCVLEWISRPEEFICRAGFVLMAVVAVHQKNLPEDHFIPYFSLIANHVYDERPIVNKAINWALRQMGKRSSNLHNYAVITSKELINYSSSAARRVGLDALRELQDPQIVKRVYAS